jgi:hypothetical protein
MKSIMHRTQAHVRYMTLRELDFESSGEGCFLIMYVILVDIMNITLHYVTLQLRLCIYSSIVL